jgi:4-oxalocrotonate tautomerase
MNAEQVYTEVHSISRRGILGFTAAAAAFPISIRIGDAQAAPFTPTTLVKRHTGISPRNRDQERIRMPLVRIDIDASTSQEVRGTICNAVYDAMTSTARVPAHDKFMVVSEHGVGDLVFPQEGYLGIKYTPGIVFIQITWNAGRTTDVKKAFYKKVAEDIHAKTGIRGEDVWINLVEVSPENWSFGNGEMQYAPK